MAGKKQEFTIQRGNEMERTVVGIDGKKHIVEAKKQGKDGHFKNEGQYRRAIDAAVAENSN